MAQYKRGDVVYASVPYTDLSTIENKYVLVVLRKTDDNLTLCRITKRKKNLPNRIPIYRNDFSTGKLKISPSFVLIDKILTIHSGLVKKYVGTLKQEKMQQILKKISIMFLD